MWKLMEIKEKTGIELTERYIRNSCAILLGSHEWRCSLAMHPAASVSGLYFASPAAQYFSLGKITEEQVRDYAARKSQPVEEVERWLGSSLSYK